MCTSTGTKSLRKTLFIRWSEPEGRKSVIKQEGGKSKNGSVLLSETFQQTSVIAFLYSF